MGNVFRRYRDKLLAVSTAPWFDLSVWRTLRLSERSHKLQQLAELLADFQLLTDSANEPFFLHRTTQLAFRFVAGGWFEAGFGPRDRQALQGFGYPTTEQELGEIAAGCSTRELRHVDPLLMTVSPLTSADYRRISNNRVDHDTPEQSTALSLAEQAGFRLPSDAELEFVRRDGGEGSFFVSFNPRAKASEMTSRFGLANLHSPEWTNEVGRLRPGVLLPLQSESEIVLALAARSERYDVIADDADDLDDEDAGEALSRWVRCVLNEAARCHENGCS